MLRYDGYRLLCTERVCDIGWDTNEADPIYVEVDFDQVGGKPVSYLFSPTEMVAVVSLSLVPS